MVELKSVELYVDSLCVNRDIRAMLFSNTGVTLPSDFSTVQVTDDQTVKIQLPSLTGNRTLLMVVES